MTRRTRYRALGRAEIAYVRIALDADGAVARAFAPGNSHGGVRVPLATARRLAVAGVPVIVDTAG
jgi:hypothetical protein